MKRLNFKFYQMGNLQMSQVNYDAMSDAQLKEYFLKHRGDRSALQAHLDRINQRPLRVIASPGDPDFDEKVRSAIRQKLEAASSTTHQQTNQPNVVDG
jgi:predicted metal-dependent RNase